MYSNIVIIVQFVSTELVLKTLLSCSWFYTLLVEQWYITNAWPVKSRLYFFVQFLCSLFLN